MKDIYIRNKFNKKISNEVKEEIENIKYLKSFKFENVNSIQFLIKDGFYRLKFAFDFHEEDLEFLENIKTSINSFDFEKLIYLCDSYEFRFFKVFDYISRNVVIDCNNFKKIYSIFMELLKKGETVNSISLAIFVLSVFDFNQIIDFCKNVLCRYIDYLEISSFILKNYNVEDNYTYFDLFKYVYKNVNITELLDGLNKIYSNSYRKFIVSFYLFNIKDLNLRDLNDFDFKILLRYVSNCRKSLNNISDRFLFEDKFNEFKNINEDLNLVLNKMRDIVKERFLNYENFDMEFIYLNINLFDDLKEIYLGNEFLNFIFVKLTGSLYDRNFREVKQIIMVYNQLHINISEKISEIFNKEYSSVEFGKFILRSFRDYEYFTSIISELEKRFYLTKLVNDFEFRIILFRSLCIVYKDFNFEIVGSSFLNIIMDYQEFYDESSSYINFIAQKILERS